MTDHDNFDEDLSEDEELAIWENEQELADITEVVGSDDAMNHLEDNDVIEYLEET